MFPPSTIGATKSKLNTGKARRSVETQSLTSSDPKIASSNDAEFLKNADLELCLLGKKKNPLEKDISVQNYEVLETLKISAPIAREVITRTLVDAIHSGKNSTQVKAKLPQTSETEKFRPVYAVKAKYQDRTRDYLFDFSTNEIDTAPLVVVSSHAGKDSQSLIRRYSVMTHYGTIFDVLFNTHDPTFIDRNKSTVYVAMQNFRIGDELRQGTVVRWGMYNCYLTGQEIEELDFPKHPGCKKPVPVITFLKKDQFSYPSLKAVSEGANAPDATHESNLEANRQNAVKPTEKSKIYPDSEPEFVGADELSQSELEFLRNAESLTLVPAHYADDAPGQQNINHYPAGGGRTLKTAELRNIVIENLKESTDHADYYSPCFEPSFGIEAKRGNEVHNYLISIGCYQLIEYLHSKTENKAIHYRMHSQFWPVFQILLENVPGYSNSHWYKSLTAKRTIKTGEAINESKMLQRWVLGSPVKENTSANGTVPNDYVVTGIDYKLHPVCVDTIIAGKPIHAHQMKFLDPH